MIYEDEHEKQSVLPPPGLAQPIEPQPLKATTAPERHVQQSAGGWSYSYMEVAGEHVLEAFGPGKIMARVIHRDQEVAQSALNRAVEILMREVPV